MAQPLLLTDMLFSQGFGTRRICAGLVEQGWVEVDEGNGMRAVTDTHALLHVQEGMTFQVQGVLWQYHAKAYVMLHKPVGHECSHKPSACPSVYSLLPTPLRQRPARTGLQGVQAVGRLDQDTTGMLVLTDDGQLIHRMSSPRHHVPKVYEVTTADALDAKRVPWETLPGEGAFYGPKIEFSLKDSIGRVWQCGTIQVDFSMPGRLGAEYVDEDNTRKTPVMLHRAIVGSMERFIGILIENFAGALPVWLAPVQVVVMNITANQAAYLEAVLQQMRGAGLRVEGDLRNEKITYKIREHSLQKLPYQVILGDKEMASQTVAVRTRKGEDLGQMPVSAFIERLQHEAQSFGRAA